MRKIFEYLDHKNKPEKKSKYRKIPCLKAHTFLMHVLSLYMEYIHRKKKTSNYNRGCTVFGAYFI